MHHVCSCSKQVKWNCALKHRKDHFSALYISDSYTDTRAHTYTHARAHTHPTNSSAPVHLPTPKPYSFLCLQGHVPSIDRLSALVRIARIEAARAAAFSLGTSSATTIRHTPHHLPQPYSASSAEAHLHTKAAAATAKNTPFFAAFAAAAPITFPSATTATTTPAPAARCSSKGGDGEVWRGGRLSLLQHTGSTQETGSTSFGGGALSKVALVEGLRGDWMGIGMGGVGAAAAAAAAYEHPQSSVTMQLQQQQLWNESCWEGGETDARAQMSGFGTRSTRSAARATPRFEHALLKMVPDMPEALLPALLELGSFSGLGMV